MNRDGLTDGLEKMNDLSQAAIILLILTDFFSVFHYFYQIFTSSTPPAFAFAFATIIDLLCAYTVLFILHQTLRSLACTRQSNKRSLFEKLHFLLIWLTILATCFNLFYSVLLFHKFPPYLLRWQWFFIDGVWVLLQLVFWICMMVGKNDYDGYWWLW